MKKTKDIFVYIFILSMLITLITQSALAADIWSGKTQQPSGSGDSSDPYQIGTAEELAWFAEKVNGNSGKALYAELTDDIVLNDTTDLANWAESAPDNAWTPIGYSNATRFVGSFNGNNYTISGIYISSTASNQSLFGYVGSGSTVQSLRVVDSYIQGGANVGGVFGYLSGSASSYSTINNCYSAATVVSTGNCAGGIVGYNNYCKINNCQYAGTINSNGTGTDFGGICGCNYGAVSYSYNTGAVYAPSNKYAGGICGSNYGTIENTYNTGPVTGNMNVGGICGFNSKTISNIYNTGPVSGNSRVGGICGTTTGTLSNAYYLDTSADQGSGYASSAASGTVVYKSADEFASGEVAYLLGDAFGQTLGTDPDPVFRATDDSNAVYKLTYMNGTSVHAVQYYNSGNTIESINNPSSDSGSFTGWDTQLTTMPANDVTLYAVFDDTTSETIEITTTSLPSGTEGSAYTAQIETEGSAQPTFSITTGALPAGLSLNTSTGVISGTPDVVGTGTFTIKAANSAGTVSDTQQFSITVEKMKLEITTKSLPSGKINTAYSAFIVAQGGTSYSFLVISGSLPAGLSLNADTGQISGSPTESGIILFTIRVVNGSETYDQNLSIEVTEDLSGDGTEAVPYEIWTAQQLRQFAKIVNTNSGAAVYAVLKADIALNDTSDWENWDTNPPAITWTPIGSDIKNVFNGSFDGNNHTINGIYISGSSDYQGLFGYIYNATVQNLIITESYIKGNDLVGGICGAMLDNSSISNCSNSAAVIGASTQIGGICGYVNTGNSIENCHNNGTIMGTKSIGGIVGYNSGAIAYCYNTGAVSSAATGCNYGGICGLNANTVSNVYNTGTIIGSTNVGAICGYSSGTLSNGYYLDTSADEGIGCASSAASETVVYKSAAEFTSGEVAYLLGDAFGQTLGTDTGPVFRATDNSNAVYNLTYMDGSSVYAAQYYNGGNTVSAAGIGVPSSGSGTFSGWNGLPSTMPANDVTVTSTYSAAGASASVINVYTITASAGTGGSISPSGSVSVAYGNDKTYTITPDDGYEIEDVLVDGASVGAVSAYTFDNVKKAHTITVSFREKEKETVNPFADVNTDDWFYDSVMYAYENGLMTGMGENAFNPGGTMTRAMLVTVLYRMSGDTGSYTNTFSDVPSGEWYEQAAAWAAANGITSGIGGNCFGPDNEISREQLAVMLYNYAKYKGYDVSIGEDMNILSYNDALDISDYAYSALQWACGAGIMNGDDNGNLNPQSSATRAEVAAVLQRFIENVIN